MSGHTPYLPGPRWLTPLAWLLLAMCGGAATPAPEAVQQAPGAPAPTPEKAAAPAKAPAAPALKLGEVREEGVALPLPKLLGQSVADVQALLGEPVAKGMMREHCVRFLPERTRFACKYAHQSYADKTGNFGVVQVTYEDGVATAVGLDGYKHATGPFDPIELLRIAGLTLPEPGRESKPQANVRLWSWFNQYARLRIHDKQYRVEVSAVDDQWQHSRVEVILNERLTPEEKARVLGPDGGQTPGPAEPAGSDAKAP